MGWLTVLEGVDVVPDRLYVDATLSRSLFEQGGVVDTLSPAEDLLATHEEVVTVGVVGVITTRHRVEGTCVLRVSVQHVEIRIVHLLHDGTQFLRNSRFRLPSR